MGIRLRDIALFGGFTIVGLVISCGEVQVEETIDPEVQLAEDIAIIEEYLALNEITEYDTLESEVRVVILEEGEGDPIEYGDLIFYDYIGRFTDELVFDTTIDTIAIIQDELFTTDTVFLKSQVNPELDSLDDDGNRIIEDIDYAEDYLPVYNEARDYESFFTTHTPGGWFLQQESAIQGFVDGVHVVLDSVNLRGRGLILLPSEVAYGQTGSFPFIDPNTVIMFEIIPDRKK